MLYSWYYIAMESISYVTAIAVTFAITIPIAIAKSKLLLPLS